MIGILVVAHGGLAEQLVTSGAMIMGRVPMLRAVGLKADQSLDDFAREIDAAWRALEEEGAEQVLILVDMFGGSCSNVAARLVRDRDARAVALVTGANLPMVLEAAIDRDLYPLPTLVEKVIKAGRKSIVDVQAALAGRMP